MSSIQRRLTLRLLAGALLLTAAAGSFVYFYAKVRLTGQLDRELATKASAISSLMLNEGNGHLEFDFSPEAMQEFSPGPACSYFEIWRENGEVVERSPSLNSSDLLRPTPLKISGFNVRLPRGAAGRAIALRFVPRPDEIDGVTAERAGPPQPLTLICAQGRGEVDEALAAILTALLITAAALSAGVLVAVILTVRRGLRPLTRLAAEADAIGAASLGHRFSATELPAELQPIAQRLNSLLDRLSQAFARERRFTADAAHELRTPLAELRSMAEVALRYPDQHDDPAENYRETLAIARQMETIVSTLLAISRCQSGRQTVQLRAASLHDLVQQAWKPYENLAGTRGLTLQKDVPQGAAVQCDPAMSQQMLANLFENAATYATRGTSIQCAARVTGSAIELSIANCTNDLGPEDLPHIFEPFWRKDASRSGTAHSGLGLALVAAYASAFGATIKAELPSPGLLCIKIVMEAAEAEPQRNRSVREPQLIAVAS